MILVIDASVAVKWFVREPGHEAARQILLEGGELHAPDPLIPEIADIAWKKQRRREITRAQAGAIVQALKRAPVRLHAAADLTPRALRIAMAIGHPVHDCLYLACAEAVNCPLITADERFRRALATTPFRAMAWKLE